MKPTQSCLLFIFYLLSISITQAQKTSDFDCGFDALRTASRTDGIHSFEEQLRLHYSQKETPGFYQKNLASLPYVVPVVVHIIHNGGPENIPDALILAAIDHLNAGFAGQGPFVQQGATVNTQIQFCLAKRDPDGNATTGITRTQSPLTNMVMEIEDIQTKDLNRWNPKEYVNIWVVNEISSLSLGLGVAGYAFFPSSHGQPEDGMICEARFFGQSAAEDAVLIHEMGHYFGLYHTFEGGCTNNDCTVDGDHICDTPPDKATHTTCPFNSCSTDVAPGSPFNSDVDDFTGDFMDYSPFSCFYFFTADQALRMQGSLETVRKSLLDSKGCLDPCTQPAIADFSAFPNPVPAGGTVVFTNNSTGATNFSWSENGVFFSSNAQESRVFTSPGNYLIELQATNSDPNCTDKTSVVVQVNCPIIADFSFSPNPPKEGETVVFTNLSTGGATNFEWFINGQSVATSLNFSYLFPVAGDFSVVLQASNGFCSSEKQWEVNVEYVCGQMAQNARFHSNLGILKANKILPLPDGSVLWAGYESAQPMLARVTENNTVIWAKHLSRSNNFNGVRALPDGHFIAITDSLYLIKFDISGNIIWQKKAENLGTMSLFRGSTTFAVGLDGSVLFVSSNTWNAYFSKIDKDGNWLWSREILFSTGSGTTVGVEQALDNSGDWLVTNTARVVHRISDSGNLISSKQLNYSEPISFISQGSLAVHPDGGYSILGNYGNGSNDTMIKALVRFNGDGSVRWAKKYVPSTLGVFPQGASYFPNEGWVDIESDYSGNNQLFRIDENGSLSWTQGIVSTYVGLGGFSAYKKGGGIRFVSIANNKDLLFALYPDAPTSSIAENCLLAPSIPHTTFDITVAPMDTMFPFIPIVANIQDGTAQWINSQWTKSDLCAVPIPCVEICDNELDDDEDGLVDCFDFDCPCFDSDTACLVNPPVNNFAAKLAWESLNNGTSMSAVPIVANLNPLQDSIPEILVIEGVADGATTVLTNKLLIFKGDGSNASAPNSLLIPEGMEINLPVHPTVADLDANGIPEVILITRDGLIRIYTNFAPNATPCMTLWAVSNKPMESTNARIYAADFDGDGIGEVFCGNDVFKLNLSNPTAPALTKVLNGVGAEGNFAGLPLEYAQSSTAADLLSPADCNGDPDCNGLEIAAGYNIYSVDLDPNDGDGLQIKIQRDLNLMDPNATYSDGYTATADLDLDGIPEIIVSGVRNLSSGGFYVWNKNGLVQEFNYPSFDLVRGMVCVADVYDDKAAGFSQDFPELIVCQRLGMVCFNLQKAQSTPAQPFWWQLPTTDRSGATGATVFDFNGDGLSEIVYRDEDNLRIMYGGAAPFPMGVDAQRNWFKTVTGSLTLDEYPVVADLDHDGEAEIAVAGYDYSVLANNQIVDTRAKLRVFESANLPWQPARAIWNQYNYFGVNINDDLTVPKVQQKHWLEMGSIGSGKRPFNTHLAQVSSLNPFITSKVKAPDATIIMDSTICQTDSMEVFLSICNLGRAVLPAGTPLSFYNGDPTSSPATLLFPPVLLNESIAVGACKTIKMSIPTIYNTNIFVVINDDGTIPRPFSLTADFPSTNQTECHYENNMISFITQSQPPVLDLGPDILMCKNSVVSLSADPNFQRYRWQDGSTNSNFTAYTPGKYWVDVYDACGYRQSDTVNIVLNTLNTLNLPDELIFCPGEPIQLVASGFSKYTWAPADSVSCSSCAGVNLVATQSLTLYLTAAVGDCFVSDSVRIKVNPLPSLSLLAQDGDCQTPASITANVLGNGPFEFLWSDSSIDSVLNTSQSGAYTVEVTDQNGCHTNQSATVSILNSLDISANLAAPSCAGMQTGSVDLMVNGGTLPMQFLWSNNATTEDLSNAGAGIYSVLTTDANGCTATYSVTLSEPAAIQLSLHKADPKCAGDPSGTLDLSASGGTGILAFLWSNNAVIEDLSGLSSGTYTVVTTDTNGCTATLSETLSDPPAIVLSLQKTDPKCVGESSGALDLSASGGTGNLAFLWSNNTVIEDLSSLSSGTYTVVTTDANGCTTTLSETLSDPPAIVLSLQKTDPKCLGESSGALDLTASGGTGNLAFLWSNNAAIEDPGGLSSGNYTVVTTDANGCTATLTETLTDPSAIVLSLQKTDPKCTGDSSGVLDLTASGGTGNLAFLWSNNTVFEDLNGLSSGTYTVVTTDANGCTTTLAQTLTDPAAIVLSLQKTDPKCASESSGALDLTALGGTGNLAFLWSNSAVIQDLSGLPPGTYSVVVTDANGCTATIAETLTDPPMIVLGIQKTDLPCLGASAWINVTISGGAAPFAYLWSNHETTEDIQISESKTYQITVTDMNGCATSDSVEIAQLSNLIGVAMADSVRCFGETNGSIRIISTSGGTPPWSYSIDNLIFKPEPLFENLAAGNYQIFVRDANNCTFSNEIEVFQPAPILVALTGDTLVLQGATADLQAIIIGSNNVVPTQIEWLANGLDLFMDQLEVSVQLLGNTLFQIKVSDEKGCSATDTWWVRVDEAHKIYVPNIIFPESADGDNRTFQIFSDLSILEIESLNIFDRWGNQVFSNHNFQPNIETEGWDGTFRGKKMSPGVYVWTAKVLFKDGTTETFKGDLTLFR